ncbi:hypothetical protein [Selenomonas noxia]|jgi:hypothetical protein|uniref:hypothetical protein n=1 Tax=Selenomonas noxia TaxID=135083 RepID=UPI0028D3FBAF|nr:hypothetical protein [Selenomonas noxia]
MSSKEDEIAISSLVLCHFCRISMSMGLSIPCYLHGQGGRGDDLANGALLFEEGYEKSDADFSLEECQILRLIGLGNLQRVHGNLGSDTRACNEVLDVL